MDCKEYNLYNLNASNLKTKETDLIESKKLCYVTDNTTGCYPDCAYTETFVNLEILNKYIISAVIFNIEWNTLQADEILLNAIQDLKLQFK